MALIIRNIDSETKACLEDAFGYEFYLGLHQGISDKAEEFLKEKGIGFDVVYEKGVRILNVKDYIEDEILDELDEIADERLSDPDVERAYYGTKYSLLRTLEDYVRLYGEDLD